MATRVDNPRVSRCPYCSKFVPLRATKCRSCGAAIDLASQLVPPSTRLAAPPGPVAADERADLRAASYRARFLAWLIDLTFAVLMLTLFVNAATSIAPFRTEGTVVEPQMPRVWPPPGWVLVFLWLGRTLAECSAMQGTLGKWFLELRVADPNGNRLSFGASAGRNLLKIVWEAIPLAFLLGPTSSGARYPRTAKWDAVAESVVVDARPLGEPRRSLT